MTSTLGNGITNTTSKLGKERWIIMTREEILAKAHTDYKNNDPIELEKRNTSITVGTLVAGIESMFFAGIACVIHIVKLSVGVL